DEHASARPALPDRLCRTQALVGVRRGHPNVDDSNVGVQLLDEREQLLGVAGKPHEFEPGLCQQASEPFAENDRVVGDHYTHGISACSLVPRPGGLDTTSVPPRASTRSMSPRIPEPPRKPAPPIPSSATSTTSVSLSREAAIRTSWAW